MVRYEGRHEPGKDAELRRREQQIENARKQREEDARKRREADERRNREARRQAETLRQQQRRR